MKVRCVRLVNSVSGEPEARSPWLTVGSEYVVLALSVVPGRNVTFRLIGNDGRTPALFAASQFEIIRGNIPSVWEVQIEEEGRLEIGPRPWLRPGFWEDYFDGMPEATTEFEAARVVIVSESLTIG